MSVAAVILAAGYSRRLGRPKQDAILQGRTLLQYAVDAARGAALSPVLVVVRENYLAPQLPGARLVLNRQAEEGMASSVRVGIAALAEAPEVVGVVLMACDQPLLSPEHLLALGRHRDHVTGSAYAGRVGVPAYFPAPTFAALQLLQGDAGARLLLAGAAAVRNEELALDIDTEDDLQQAHRLLGQRAG